MISRKEGVLRLIVDLLLNSKENNSEQRNPKRDSNTRPTISVCILLPLSSRGLPDNMAKCHIYVTPFSASATLNLYFWTSQENDP